MKNVFVLVAAFLIMGNVMVGGAQITLAGGGAPFSVLAFSSASAQSCGTWQASGYGGLSTGKWVAIFSLTDATGKLIYINSLSKIPVTGMISGTFSYNPVKNPIHFVALTLSTTSGKLSIIGDITTDDPCLPLSQSAFGTTVQPTVNSTPQPVITLAGTQTLPLNGTGTPVNIPAQPPYANFGCSSTSLGGTIVTSTTTYMRATVSLASDLNHVLSAGVAVINNQSYTISLAYPPQAAGTHLVLAVGQWDGKKYVGPTTQLGGDCVGPTPTYVRPAATTVPQPPGYVFMTPDVYLGCTSAVVSSTTTYIKYPFIKAIISLASNPDVVLDEQEGWLREGAYSIDLSYPLQAPGTGLIVTVGTWSDELKKFYDSTSLVGNCTNPTPVYTASTPTVFQQQPTIVFAPTSAAVFGPAPDVYFGCTSAIVSSSDTYINIKATYIKAIVSLASNPNVVLDQQVGTLSQGAYNIHLSYPLQAPGTNLVVAVGVWDGDFNRFMDPLLSLVGHCISPTPVYTAPVPTVVQPPPTVVFGPAPNIYIGCTSAIVSSTDTAANAPYIRAIVTWASNTNNVLAEEVQPLANNAYNIHLSYALQAPGRELAVTLGAWDGTKFITKPLSLIGNCISPTPGYTVPSPVPTLVLTAVSPQISLAALCDGVTIQGSSDRPQINIALINMADGSSVGVATSLVDNGRFLITVPFMQSGSGPMLSLPTGTHIMAKLSVLNQDGSSESRGQFETTVACNR